MKKKGQRRAAFSVRTLLKNIPYFEEKYNPVKQKMLQKNC
jgi:hypothetical protein